MKSREKQGEERKWQREEVEEKERRKDGRKKRRAEGDHGQRAATTTKQDTVSQRKSNRELEKMDRKRMIA